MSKFTHLHVHSHYSLLDGLPKIDDLINNAKQKQFEALALTDHGAMYGAIEFYKKAKVAGLKPIVGMEAYLAIDSIHDRRSKIDNDYYHLILLAKNFAGYKNLMRLTSKAHLEGFYYRPRIDKELLKDHAAGLICLSGCMRGDIPRAILNSDFEKASRLVQEYKNIFGEKNFFLEIQRHEGSDTAFLQKEKLLGQGLIKLAKDTQTPLVATDDSHYLEPTDAEAQDLLVCVGLGKTVTDSDRLDMRGINLSLKNEKEMSELFTDLPEALENSQKIADECNLEINLNERFFPLYEVPQDSNADSYLKDLTYQGLAQKFPEPLDPVIKERADYELEVITSKNYSTYFLVVADFVNWARKQGIITTTRGSAAGSLVSYVLGITTVNPLDYKLPFERFLNPLRPSPPDIDIDFADNRRDEVIEYVTQKYGQDRVAQIVTFGTMMARAAVRDMGRALAIPYAKCDKIAKMIPLGKQGFHMTIEKAMTLNPDLKDAFERDPETKRLIELSIKVEGAARHVSVHAAGLVISPTALTDYTPLQKDQNGKTITQYEMHSVEEAGLVKMDFLGIRNLSILGNTIEIVEHTRNTKIDLLSIPLDDKKSFKLLTEGKTMGLFQLGGSGMTRYMKELGPTSIFDIMAMISLYRPGPIDSIPEYIRRKHNPKLISFSDPRMKDILSPSYGIITYQDDVLLIAIQIAGYSWEEADKLRKAMGKKIPKEMAAQKEKFIQGCIDHSRYDETKAQNLWNLIEPFAAYGFNKAHAASYAIVAYQTAYMKANFTVEFMASVMTAESGDPATVADAVEECQGLNIEVLPPSINESLANFTVIDNNHIRFGLNAIKNLGSDIIKTVISERKQNGKFLDVTDFVGRINSRNFNKRSWEALAKSGALDVFDERAKLLANTDAVLEFAKEQNKLKNSQQESLFGSTPVGNIRLTLRDVEPAGKKEYMAWEKELLGLYVSAHPLEDHKSKLQTLTQPIKEIEKHQGNVTIGGIITRVQKIITKKGEQMAFFDLEDLGGTIEVLAFPSLYSKHQNLINPEKIVLVNGKVSDKDGVPKFLADEIKEFGSEAPPVSNTAPVPAVTIKIPQSTSEEIFMELKQLFEVSPGQTAVSLLINGQKVKTPFKINLTDDLSDKIKKIIEP
ncbi:MAG: DNA polymerase III subunit alpha [Candidatus Doudnabacteria bacterium]|nr:DNA polymerase III subunit alpha [Candidatus Doudnabacteria bacterium]